MARGTLRCSLFLIFGLSSIASAVLDLVSRVGTQVGTPTPTLHARRHTRPRGGSRTAGSRSERARVMARVELEGTSVCSLSSDSEITD